MQQATRPRTVVIRPDEHAVLGEAQFGMPGLVAIESIGPMAQVRASGPLITIHDSTIEAGLGIGHHPHRGNERLFYLESGTFDHDDALNEVTGHVEAGGLAKFTEGQTGMIHQEWNHGDEDARIYILVASTDPVPADMTFEVLESDRVPEVDEGAGVRTRVMVGEGSPMRVASDVRRFTDSRLEAGTTLRWMVPAGQGGVLSVREGSLQVDGEAHEPGTTVIVPPSDEERRLTIAAPGGGRAIRVLHGPGHGFVTA